MTDLVAKLEALTGPCREMDAMIHHAKLDGAGTGYASSAPAYTASIDAAMTLVPESMAPLLDWRGAHCRLRFYDGSDVEGAHALAITPAIALCIAALKARQS